jgi:type I restriction enzyme S subunit
VAKIEALFEESRTAREALDRIPPLLKKFRQAVLAAAFRGDLTREWREQHPEVDPPETLLEWAHSSPRALDKRRGPRGGRPELTPAAISGLFELPGTWFWASVGDLFEVSTGGTPSRKVPAFWNGSVPWVSSGEVAFSRIRGTRERITEEGLQNSNAKIHPPGTVLLAMIGEGKTRGQAAILDIPASTNQNVAAILCGSSLIPPEYVFWWLRYRYDETRFLGEGGAQPALNALKVRTLPIPVAPRAEEAQIVGRLEDLLGQAAAIEAGVDAARLQAEKLEQSILARAFRGELVLQHPNDEPASVVLWRIRTRAREEARPAQAEASGGRRGNHAPPTLTN